VQGEQDKESKENKKDKQDKQVREKDMPVKGDDGYASNGGDAIGCGGGGDERRAREDDLVRWSLAALEHHLYDPGADRVRAAGKAETQKLLLRQAQQFLVWTQMRRLGGTRWKGTRGRGDEARGEGSGEAGVADLARRVDVLLQGVEQQLRLRLRAHCFGLCVCAVCGVCEYARTSDMQSSACNCSGCVCAEVTVERTRTASNQDP
jgi:hypothetical protein